MSAPALNPTLHRLMRQYGGIIIALFVLCTVFALSNSRFLTLANFMNIFQQVAVVAIAAFGMTWVILLGEIDLSVGSIIAVAGMVGAQALALGTGFPRSPCSSPSPPVPCLAP